MLLLSEMAKSAQATNREKMVKPAVSDRQLHKTVGIGYVNMNTKNYTLR